MGQRERLNAFLRGVKNQPFKLGRNDCLTFSNEACRALYGYGFADDWKHRYMDGLRFLRQSELKKEFQAKTLVEFLDRNLVRAERPKYGTLVVTNKSEKWYVGGALGISTGSKSVFLSKSGLVSLSQDQVDAYWSLECPNTS